MFSNKTKKSKATSSVAKTTAGQTTPHRALTTKTNKGNALHKHRKVNTHNHTNNNNTRHTSPLTILSSSNVEQSTQHNTRSFSSIQTIQTNLLHPTTQFSRGKKSKSKFTTLASPSSFSPSPPHRQSSLNFGSSSDNKVWAIDAELSQDKNFPKVTVANGPEEDEKVYSSGSEVDESEELHNKKLIRLGKWNMKNNITVKMTPKMSPLQRYLAWPEKRFHIEKLQHRYDLWNKTELTTAEVELLHELEGLSDEITSFDETEYKLWQDVKADAFNKFKLKPQNFPPPREVTEGDLKKLARFDFDHAERYYEEHPEERCFPRDAADDDDDSVLNGDNNIITPSTTTPPIPNTTELSSNDPKAKKPHNIHANRPYSLPTDPAPEEWSQQDHKRMLQKLWGQPANGNPELLYIPGLKLLWREDKAPLDKNGNMLPVDYNNHHLHDPYDYFYPDTTTVFDPPKNPVQDIDDNNRREAYDSMTMEEQVMRVRQSITDPVELHSFDSTIVALLTPEFYAKFCGPNNFYKPYSDRHWIYEALNHPDPEQRYIPLATGPQDWEEFLLYDFHTAPKKLKWFTLGLFATVFGFAGLMTLEGVMACQQYFYDIEHPLH